VKFHPEEPSEPLEGIPDAEPGEYLMTVANWREDIQLANGVSKDVIDFTGENAEGVTVGASLWLRGPWTRDDGTKSKGNVWQYRKLAEALGDDALEQYRTKDEDGYSTFRPTDWKRIPVKITVDAYGVSEIDPAPSAPKAETTKKKKTAAELADEEIPF
jgi:hypothetical protein